MKKWYEKCSESLFSDYEIKGFFEQYRWLSNFYPCTINYCGYIFKSTESAYQAAKVPYHEMGQFQSLEPSEAKKLGRIIPLRPDWGKVKDGVMYEILVEKFSNLELRLLLLETGDRYLEETNWWGDTYWGVCKGKGQNKLGKILMKIREKIKEGFL